jgi:uncharacterized membrane protein YfcA
MFSYPIMDLMLTLAVLLVALIAGILGALLGLGGGIIVIPALTLALGFNMQEAIGASLVGVIASSTGSAARYVREGFTNIRLGMLLETSTTIGSILGAIVAIYLDQKILLLLFSGILIYSSVHMLTKKEKVFRPEEIEKEDQLLDLSCTYVDPKSGNEVCYGVKGVKTGLGASLAAGGLSGLLGVGGGVIKVPVMNACMCVPMKAATATSNFMIGVTALAGALIYFRHGLIEPVLGASVAIGVLFGAMVGTRLIDHVDNASLRRMFGAILILVAFLMVLKALGILEAV